jgi:uncharacterized protein
MAKRDRMRVVVTGATGTIGSALTSALLERGDEVVALTRNWRRSRLDPAIEVFGWAQPAREQPPRAALAGADAVVHLLGEPVDQRWTAEAKQAIRESRVGSTRQLVAALRELPEDERPGVLVSQSATGYYGPRDGQPLDERSAPGPGFLAVVVDDWERAALGARDHMRVVLARTGVVLSPGSGALGRMLPFFRLGVGGPVAGGRQFVPWVHLDDVVAALLACLDDPRLQGPVNVTAPDGATNRELARALGRVLHRPAVLPVPGFALRVLYGEMADIVLTGQRVAPRRLEQLGHAFRQPELEPALRDVLGQA